MKSGSILPNKSHSGFTLGIVISCMSYLACLALGAHFLTNSITGNWLQSAGNSMTIQIVETAEETANTQAERIMAYLKGVKQITQATRIERAEMVTLLEPWLGAGNIIEELPLPILIELTPAPNAGGNWSWLSEQISLIASGAHLDDHHIWQERIERFSSLLTLLSIAILCLIGLCASVVIIFATRASLIANMDILEVLHLVGAQDGFVIKRVSLHFARWLGFSGLAGFGGAVFSFFLLSPFIEEAGNIELYFWLCIIPLSAVLIGACLAAQFVVFFLRARL